MQLPHAKHQTELPIAELVSSALNAESGEVELAASVDFYEEAEAEEEGASFEVFVCYLQYFNNIAAEISKSLGPTAFNGGLPEAYEWCDALGIEPSCERIAVWATGEQHLYLQIVWEDKDCPIVVSLGAG